jgi:hypothetical protein
MEVMKGFLKGAGYQDCEIWAMDYLGENNFSLDLNAPHRNHIAQFRTFVDSVKDYLDVRRLDFIAHSSDAASSTVISAASNPPDVGITTAIDSVS